MRSWWNQLPSARAQLLLFGGTFLGAVALAILGLLLRDRVFEPWVRESYPKLSADQGQLVEELTADRIEPDRQSERLDQVTWPENGRAIYGAWIENPALDPKDQLARRLAQAHPDWLLRQLQGTLVAGNLSQRARALDWLRLFPTEQAEAARRLADYAQKRARHRRELDLLEKADVVLEQLSPPDDAPVTH